jgi:hypothetical protein
MTTFLTSSIEANIAAAEQRVFINMVKFRAAQGPDFVGDGTISYGDLSGLTDAQIAALKIYDTRAGVLYPHKPGVTKYSPVYKANGIDKWLILKPDAVYMTDVIDVMEEAYNENWEPLTEV